MEPAYLGSNDLELEVAKTSLCSYARVSFLRKSAAPIELVFPVTDPRMSVEEALKELSESKKVGLVKSFPIHPTSNYFLPDKDLSDYLGRSMYPKLMASMVHHGLFSSSDPGLAYTEPEFDHLRQRTIELIWDHLIYTSISKPLVFNDIPPMRRMKLTSSHLILYRISHAPQSEESDTPYHSLRATLHHSTTTGVFPIDTYLLTPEDPDHLKFLQQIPPADYPQTVLPSHKPPRLLRLINNL